VPLLDHALDRFIHSPQIRCGKLFTAGWNFVASKELSVEVNEWCQRSAAALLLPCTGEDRQEKI